jgi:hypothetical protein
VGIVRIRTSVRAVEEGDPRVTEAFGGEPRLIGGGVADHHDLEVLVRLRQHRRDRALREQLVVVVRWDHDRYERVWIRICAFVLLGIT